MVVKHAINCKKMTKNLISIKTIINTIHHFFSMCFLKHANAFKNDLTVTTLFKEIFIGFNSIPTIGDHLLH